MKKLFLQGEEHQEQHDINDVTVPACLVRSPSTLKSYVLLRVLGLAEVSVMCQRLVLVPMLLELLAQGLRLGLRQADLFELVGLLMEKLQSLG